MMRPSAHLPVAIALWAFVFAGGAYAGPKEDEMLKVEEAWSRAIATNDVRGMDAHTADDWVIVDTNGSVSKKAGFMAAVINGDLVHDGLTLDPDTVRVYGDTAIVSGIARSSGTYKGQRFSTHERSTDLFVRQDGRWRCVFTQLTAIGARQP